MIALLLARLAAANPNYPGYINVALGLDYYPTCTLCHLTISGGKGTATKPFATTAQDDYELTGANTREEIADILAQMETDETDSDGDGVGDIDELRAGTDPNASGGTLEPPQYGCLSTTSRVAPTAFLGLLALGLVRRRR